MHPFPEVTHTFSMYERRQKYGSCSLIAPCVYTCAIHLQGAPGSPNLYYLCKIWQRDLFKYKPCRPCTNFCVKNNTVVKDFM